MGIICGDFQAGNRNIVAKTLEKSSAAAAHGLKLSFMFHHYDCFSVSTFKGE